MVMFNTNRKNQCTLNHELLIKLQMVNFKSKYINNKEIQSVALFGCDMSSVMHAFGDGVDFRYLFVQQGFECKSSPVRARGKSAPLLDTYRELEGVVPDVLIFPSGVKPLIKSANVFDAAFGNSEIPDFNKHMVVLDLFYKADNTNSVHSKDYFVKNMLLLANPRDRRKSLRVAEAHDVTSLTLAHVELQRDIARFTAGVYGVDMPNFCDDSIVAFLRSGSYEHWYIVFSWEQVDSDL